MFLDGIEKRLNDFAFAVPIAVHEGMHTQALRVAKHATDHQDALQVQRQKVRLPFVLPGLHPGGMDLLIGGVCRMAMQLAQTRDIGNGFDVKHQDRPSHKQGCSFSAQARTWPDRWACLDDGFQSAT